MKNILLIGAGRFGRHMAEQLTQLGHQVMAVDINEERINDLLPSLQTPRLETAPARISCVPWASQTSTCAS